MIFDHFALTKLNDSHPPTSLGSRAQRRATEACRRRWLAAVNDWQGWAPTTHGRGSGSAVSVNGRCRSPIAFHDPQPTISVVLGQQVSSAWSRRAASASIDERGRPICNVGKARASTRVSIVVDLSVVAAARRRPDAVATLKASFYR